jgi:putative transcriptional regulator
VELSQFIRNAHFLIEAREKKRITQPDMAARIGVAPRTYVEYERGTNAPLAMRALLNLLSSLDDEDAAKLIRAWQKDNNR